MRTKKKYLYILQAAALAIAAILYFGLKTIPLSKSPIQKDAFFYVTRIVDGDTLKLSSGERVRLIGVDTPELHYSGKLLKDARRASKDIKSIQELGRKAANFTESLCRNKKVRMELDVEKRDRYQRILAYAYLEDGTFVNAKILEEGYGQVMTIPPNVKYAEYFLSLEKEARLARKGLWGIADTYGRD